jgi:hypothetical protein
MIFRTTVQLFDDDSFLYSADAAAAQVLAALGGNPTKDTATVSIQQASMGSAGAPDPTQPPPLPPAADAE